MPFEAIITPSQGSNCARFTITDGSTYTVEAKNTFSSRKLTLQKSDGSYVTVGTTVYNEYVWPYAAGDAIEITGLTWDLAITAVMTLVSSAPQTGSVYADTQIFSLTCFTNSAYFTNTSLMSTNQSLEKNPKFVRDVIRLFIEQSAAVKAAAEGNMSSAQASLDRAEYITNDLKTGY
jgi:hypothetical protein